jgi:nucleotide-binding universal stress UspA family protein
MATVVVGVDSSDGAKRALAFALEEARLRKTALRVVHVWSFPAIAGSGVTFTPSAGFDFEQPRGDAERRLNSVLDEVVGANPGVAIERQLVEGRVTRVLVEKAQGADLLVVGSRGHRGLTGLLLGSIGQQCVQHAPCPVAIVPRVRKTEHRLRPA